VSPVQTDPFDFVNGTTADGDQVDARFLKLYQLQNPAIIGIDDSNIKPLGIGTASLAANAVTAAKIEAQQAWQTVALGGILSGNLPYMKDSMGFVHLGVGGFVTSGGAPSTIATLPAGYRPVGNVGAAFGISVAGNPTLLKITSAGVMSVDLGPTGAGFTLYFGSVTFRAEN
jgi:hypothetical protein